MSEREDDTNTSHAPFCYHHRGLPCPRGCPHYESDHRVRLVQRLETPPLNPWSGPEYDRMFQRMGHIALWEDR